MKRLLLALCVLALAVAAQAQTAVQNTATRADAATRCDSSTGVGATNTLTLQNPGPGLSNYVTSIVATMEATGVIAAASPVAITSTGFNGTSPTFGSIPLAVTTTGQVESPIVNIQGVLIKTNTNVAATLVIAASTNGTSRLTACYFPAP